MQTARNLELIPKPGQLTLTKENRQLLLTDSELIPTLVASTNVHHLDTTDDHLLWAMSACDRAGYLITSYELTADSVWVLSGPQDFHPIPISLIRGTIEVIDTNHSGEILGSWKTRTNVHSEPEIIGWAADVVRDDGYQIIGYQKVSETSWVLAQRRSPAISESMYVSTHAKATTWYEWLINRFQFHVECSYCGVWSIDRGIPGSWTRKGANGAAVANGWIMGSVILSRMRHPIITFVCRDCSV
jgi:hypothetical protein